MGMTAKQVMKILKKNGWKFDRIEGSHHIFVKKGCLRPIPVPYHKGKDNNLGDFAKEILKEANIDPKTLKEVEK
jgi:predicted RNA binding protein YcfA (HicA-like mRNA interferase family)